MRPLLKPALRQVWRDATTLQLGVSERHRVVVENVTGHAEAVLALLDGTRDLAAVVAAAGAAGVGPAQAGEIVDLLVAAGAVEDASTAPRTGNRARVEPDLAELSLLGPPGGAARALTARAAATALVVGCGRVGAGVAHALAVGGVGRLVLRDDQPTAAHEAVALRGGVGAPRAAALARALGELPDTAVDAAAVGATRGDFERVDVVVVVPDRHAAVRPEMRALLLEAGTPWLVAGVRETTGVVGPLVLPGRSACSQCVDLHRADRDPGWAAVAARLPGRGPHAADALGAALAGVVAAVAAGEALAHVGGPHRPVSVDATIEVAVPEWTSQRLAWPAHPACDCSRRAGAAASTPLARQAAAS